jgi:YVTN family beta-propeller protein
MKNRQYVPVITALLILCSMAFLYGCGTTASSGGGSSASPWIYVGASDDLAVSYIDGSNNTLAGTIELAPRTPYHIAASPDGKHLYVSTDSLEVVVIDTATNTISGLITTDAKTESNGMAVSANGAYLYFTRYIDNKLVRAYLKSDPVTYESVFTTATPFGIILAHDDAKSIVCEQANLEFISNISFSNSSDINIGSGNIYSVAMKDGLAYVPRIAYDDVMIVDATTESITRLITPESATNFVGIVSIPGKDKLYVSQSNLAGTIEIVDTSSTPTFESTVITGETFTMSYPTFMAATADGKRVYVYDMAVHHAQICVVDTGTNKVITTIPVNVGSGNDNNPVIIYK